MNLKTVYHTFREQIRQVYGAAEADEITDWVFEALADVSRSVLLMHPDKKLDSPVRSKLEQALKKLLAHQPVQQVLGFTWFYKMKFNVNQSVLIPRPETEELVDLAIRTIPKKYAPNLQVLDIGSGSGCIPISIKKNLPQSNITSIDISEDALSVARDNANFHKVKVDFKQVDFLNAVEQKKLGKFDLIISNPPYIPVAEKEMLDKNVRLYEPAIALFVPDKDPLLFYREILQFSVTHLNKEGMILMETHQDFAKDVASLFNQKFVEVSLYKDMYGNERMVTATQFR